MYLKSLFVATAIALTASAPAVMAAQDKKIEVLHMWTSGGEAAAVGVIRDAMMAKGYKWIDVPAAGSGTLNQVLRSRVASNTAPAAVVLHAQEIAPWANEGALTDLSGQAKAGNWAKVLPASTLKFVEQDGKFFAVPAEMHRANWLWYNKKVFDRLGLKPPTTLDEFKTVATKLRAAGIIPLAIGGQNWQEGALFENVLLAVAGADFYRKAVVEQNIDALKSPTMIKVFDAFRSMNSYIDPNFAGRDWNIATQMVMKGTAGMQIVGDYAIGEYENAGLKPGVDYGCSPAPGTAGSYLSIVDAFGFFVSSKADVQKAQIDLANVVMDPAVQLKFSEKKGSIPARTDVDVSALNVCSKEAFKDRTDADAHGNVFPSIGHAEAWDPTKTGVFYDVISSFFEQPSMTSQQAVDQLVSGLQSAE